MERARRGDEDAYEELVRAHQGIAFRTAYLLAGNAADAEEAAQDGFVKAYRALGRFRAGSPFRPWLLQIVANEARNRRRSSGRRAALALRAAAEESAAEGRCEEVCAEGPCDPTIGEPHASINRAVSFGSVKKSFHTFSIKI